MSDLDDLYQLARDPEVMRFSIAGPHTRKMTSERLTDMIAMQEEIGYSPFPIFKRGNDQFIGYCGFQNLEIEYERELEITYRLLRSHWGNGYASEAAVACRNYAFQTLCAAKVISLIEPKNSRSIKVALNNGMRLEKSVIFKGIEADLYSVENHPQNHPLQATRISREPEL